MPTASLESWVALLIQVPLVGVFIWYSLESNKRWQQTSEKSQERFMEALDKRDDEFEKRNNSVITTIGSLNSAIVTQLKEMQRAAEEHDRYVRDCEAKRFRKTDT